MVEDTLTPRRTTQPLAHDVAEGARPETDKFTQNVLRPAVEDFITTLEKQADDLAEKVLSPSSPLS